MKKAKKIVKCDAEKSFYVSDGSVYASLAELAKGLRKMHPDTYAYHVNEQKNDFHNWIRDVFGDQKLAKQALGAKDQKQLAKIVAARLK
ncbi:MAG: hypothetical protein QXM31_00690 [Candidatus Woesearchaeota archaeon]